MTNAIATIDSTDTLPSSDASLDQLWEIISNQATKLTSFRTAADTNANALTRGGSIIVDTSVNLVAAATAPIVFRKFPKLAKIGKGKVYVPTQGLIAVIAIVVGGVLHTLGVTGGRALLEAGKGMGSSLAGIKGDELGQEWFAPAANDAPRPISFPRAA